MNVEGENRMENGLLFAGFNQDQGCIGVGLADGFRIYTSDPLKQKDRHDLIEGGIGQVEMLFRCNYVALVGGGRHPAFPKNKVMIWDDSKKEVTISMEFASYVCAVRLRRDRIVVVLESTLQVYTFTQPPQQLHVFETGLNSSGLCCLCPSSERALLAYPSKVTGEVMLVDLADADCATTPPGLAVRAHDHPLSTLTLSLQGNKLATASVQGTLIRVFDTKTGAKLHELRRGANQAKIYCINFSHDASMICVSSDHGTVHMFALEDVNRNRHLNVGKAKMVPKYLKSKWSFSRFQLPHANGSKASVPCICAFGADHCSVIAVCADGSYYKCVFDEKGDCTGQTYMMFLEMTD